MKIEQVPCCVLELQPGNRPTEVREGSPGKGRVQARTHPRPPPLSVKPLSKDSTATFEDREATIGGGGGSHISVSSQEALGI